MRKSKELLEVKEISDSDINFMEQGYNNEFSPGSKIDRR